MLSSIIPMVITISRNIYFRTWKDNKEVKFLKRYEKKHRTRMKQGSEGNIHNWKWKTWNDTFFLLFSLMNGFQKISILTGWNPLCKRNSRAAWQKKPNLSPSFPRPYIHPAQKCLQREYESWFNSFMLGNIIKFIKLSAYLNGPVFWQWIKRKSSGCSSQW